MRLNEPVTQHEHLLDPRCHLVSMTDPQGRILYGNPAFVEASGYPRDELMGQPHNIIRHPDMPEQAFADMWATLKKGRPWSGLVKNRRQAGDHYWVQANVTPIVDGNACVGYLSVRTHAAAADTEAAGRLYAELRRHEVSKTRAPWRIVEGRVLRNGPAGWASRLMEALAAHRLSVVPLGVAASAWALGQWGGPMQAGLVIALGLAGCAAALLRRGVERPLMRLLGFAERIAAGDLTQHMGSQRGGVVGRLERALNQMNVNLQATIGDARLEVEQMNHALAELAAGNLDLSSRTESQAASLEQTAASMEQLAVTVASNSTSATEAADLAQGTAAQSADGARAVNHVRETMLSIDTSSQRVSDITQVIDAISFQTNLLALNAAVEAARAGDHGRGFGVVATEVRALAGRTTDAARQIRALIDASRCTVATGVAQAARASELMAAGVGSVERVSTVMHDIQGASKEQQLGISQANEAVAHLDGITQQNAAMVEELSACAAALRSRAEYLQASMQIFRIGGEAGTPAPDAVQLRREARASQAVATA